MKLRCALVSYCQCFCERRNFCCFLNHESFISIYAFIITMQSSTRAFLDIIQEITNRINCMWLITYYLYNQPDFSVVVRYPVPQYFVYMNYSALRKDVGFWRQISCENGKLHWKLIYILYTHTVYIYTYSINIFVCFYIYIEAHTKSTLIMHTLLWMYPAVYYHCQISANKQILLMALNVIP